MVNSASSSIFSPRALHDSKISFVRLRQKKFSEAPAVNVSLPTISLTLISTANTRARSVRIIQSRVRQLTKNTLTFLTFRNTWKFKINKHNTCTQLTSVCPSLFWLLCVTIAHIWKHIQTPLLRKGCFMGDNESIPHCSLVGFFRLQWYRNEQRTPVAEDFVVWDGDTQGAPLQHPSCELKNLNFCAQASFTEPAK